VGSPVELTGLAQVDGDPDVCIHFLAEEPVDFQANWVSPDVADSTLIRSCSADAKLVLDFELDVCVRVEIDPDKAEIRVYNPSHAYHETLEHLISDAALPHYIAMTGYPVLHASAVVVDGRAIVALGESGAGKSTLAAHLVKRGAELAADDAVVVSDDCGTELHIVPVARPLRLFDDSVAMAITGPVKKFPIGPHTTKNHIIADHLILSAANVPVPIATVVALGQTSPLVPELLTPGQRVTALDASLFGTLGLPGHRARRFDTLASLAGALPMWGMSIAHTTVGTRRAVDQILTLHESGSVA